MRKARLQGNSLSVHLPLMFLVVVGKLTTSAFHCEKKEGGDLDATVKFGDAL